MQTQAKIARALFDWWQEPERKSPPFDESVLEYDCGTSMMTGKDWIWWVEQKPSWVGVQLLEMFASDNKAALVFQGMDPVTGLNHRVAWVLTLSVDSVICVRETVGSIE